MTTDTRRIAYEILLKVDTDGAYANSEILSREKESNDIDGDFLRRLVYGVMEKKLYLDHILDKLILRGIRSVDKKTLQILRLGLYQIMFMGSVPEYAAIDSSVELAKQNVRGKDGFVNAVLRNHLRDGGKIELPDPSVSFAKYLSVKHSIDESIIDKWISEFGEEDCDKMTEAIDFDAEHGSFAIRVNLMKNSREEVKNALKDIEIETLDSSLSQRSLIVRDIGGNRITETEIYRSGGISIQSQESTWISDLVNAKPGERVLDACAAPGGKTMALAESMDNKGKIVCWDIYEHRLEQIREQAERLGIVIASTQARDAGEYLPELEESFDAVLVDAPCSGYGVMSNKPEIRYKSIKDIRDLPDVQKRILQTCSRYVKSGGRLIYCTCTINVDENKAIVSDFLERNHWFKLEFERQLLPQEGYKGFYAAVITH
ncbi:MAG: 16S rRNA (cytosine(967)-C(5))-methyltransferase RsmB [Firmicutes bacterium]|nr:16S rRNA (cytosine(967)-C(5))-methyltransferase RsmB [Bacillota bacterium]